MMQPVFWHGLFQFLTVWWNLFRATPALSDIVPFMTIYIWKNRHALSQTSCLLRQLFFENVGLSLKTGTTILFRFPEQPPMSVGFFIGFLFFGSFGYEPMQSCSVRHVSSLSLSLSLSSASVSVYSPPSDRFDHRSFISYKYMQLCP